MSTITLTSGRHFGRGVPSRTLGHVLVDIQDSIRESIAMAFRGQSVARGKPPEWLRRAADVLFLGYGEGEGTTLAFEAPSLGEAAPSLYRQGEFFWTQRPDPCDTGFDLLADVLDDVAAGKDDSDRFDPALLRSVRKLSLRVERGFQGLHIATRRHPATSPARIDARTVKQAETLFDRTPPAQAAMILGTLDMIRISTQTFALRMGGGQDVTGVLSEGDVNDLSPLLRHPVLVSGRAVFRASGSLLRIEADEVREATDADAYFAKIPRPNRRHSDLRRVLHEQRHKRGVAAILGQWPGEESDEEVQAWLQEMG